MLGIHLQAAVLMNSGRDAGSMVPRGTTVGHGDMAADVMGVRRHGQAME